MASSKTFLLLGLVFAVLLIFSEVSARELTETAPTQTQESVEKATYGDHYHGYEHKHGYGHGHGGHEHGYGNWEHGHGYEHKHGKHEHGYGHEGYGHGGYRYGGYGHGHWEPGHGHGHWEPGHGHGHHGKLVAGAAEAELEN
ncbi:cold and drought-regulated protein CORA [Pyrus x bretschneideri]|uniref:cold and drought-regulated protein CORA n=1 Tax=Pyrus x bretschneideri TaxID=225117 RepID=UPI00202E65F0|nr:cold and drought-regulated protein CORA [Pyrus x bretschneideri]